VGSKTGAGSRSGLSLVMAPYLTPPGNCNTMAAWRGQRGHRGTAVGGSPAWLHAHVQEGLHSASVLLEDGTRCVWSQVTPQSPSRSPSWGWRWHSQGRGDTHLPGIGAAARSPGRSSARSCPPHPSSAASPARAAPAVPEGSRWPPTAPAAAPSSATARGGDGDGGLHLASPRPSQQGSAASLVPGSQEGHPSPHRRWPRGRGSLPVSYLGGVGVVLLGPAGFVAPGMRGVRVLGVGEVVRVGVPKIRLLHAWAS